jgi:hypothetical protein
MQDRTVTRDFRPLVLFTLALAVGAVGLNRATGDSWLGALAFFGIALAIGVAVGGAYYVGRRFVKRV